MQLNSEHIAAWRKVVERREAAHAADVERLDAEIAELRRELEDRPEKIVDRYVNADEMRAANQETERAYRRGDHALRQLVEIRLHHRLADDKRHCRCGRLTDDCPVFVSFRENPSAQRWENKQVERLRNGQPHMLPPNHPAVLDPRLWERWDAEAD